MRRATNTPATTAMPVPTRSDSDATARRDGTTAEATAAPSVPGAGIETAVTCYYGCRPKEAAMTDVPPDAGAGLDVAAPRVAVITGASQGLGFALADALADAGWALVVDARRADRLDPAARALSRR